MNLGYLSDEERVPERGAAALARVRRLLDADEPTMENLYAASNLFALMLFHTRRLDEAVEVSRTMIDCGQRVAARPGGGHLLFYTLQPQINILRIEGFAGDADAALAGLAGLDDLVDGRTARVGDLKFDDDAIAAAVASGLPLRPLASAIRVVDTCKILLRRGRRRELLEFAAVPRADGPGPTHAAEAPWLVHPLTLEVPRGDARLTFIRLLHFAAAVIEAGDRATAEEAVRVLADSRSILKRGAYLSPLTPARCLASLADTARRAGLTEIAVATAAEAVATARTHGDHVLVGRINGTPPDDDVDAVSPRALAATRSDLFHHLDKKGRAR